MTTDELIFVQLKNKIVLLNLYTVCISILFLLVVSRTGILESLTTLLQRFFPGLSNFLKFGMLLL